MLETFQPASEAKVNDIITNSPNKPRGLDPLSFESAHHKYAA